jgi:cytochrome c oxidase subunit 3
MGMAFALAGIAMLFVALTSAYEVRHGLDPDWRAIRMPAVLPVNTVLLLLSSVTLEFARRALKPAVALRWLAATLALGAAFVAGQLVAWRELSDAGVYLGTNAHSSFFYLLTGLHGLHLLGGIAALSYVAFECRPGSHAAAACLRRVTGVTALYWHFMDALWVYLFVLLFAWR